ALLHIKIPQGYLGVELTVLVKDRLSQRQGADDAGVDPRLPLVVPHQLQLAVGAFVHAATVSHDVRVAAARALQVAGGDHSPVGAEAKTSSRKRLRLRARCAVGHRARVPDPRRSPAEASAAAPPGSAAASGAAPRRCAVEPASVSVTSLTGEHAPLSTFP